ncbi:hypothetical protein E1B28_013025 [Marasmius oreades]|uniref:Uncharacterized protein n=1 Tax=Marasmius oreades TaxID=181124 RepID=A0A9P7UNL2_9AGAR|nr:uncharacterized protein E1B28_013025 [Marasmius oreades]KAG7087046.1 hypothetical protein E1B28_013025 [Marasmius oreades]
MQALGHPLQHHGAFCRMSTSGEVSPSPPSLPLVFTEWTREPIFELGDDTPRTTKHMRLCIEEASNKVGLDKENTKAAEQFFNVLFIKLQSIEKLLQDGMQVFQEPDSHHATLLLDTGFKSHLQTKIVGVYCLLTSRHILLKWSKLLCGQNLIRQNPDLFNVPDNFFDNQTLAVQLQKLVTEGLASARCSIKAKLNHSLEKKSKGVQAKPQPIRTLCCLAIPRMEIKGAHWTRYHAENRI